MTGYQLHKTAAEIAPFWTLTRSQVYRELADMAERGLVSRGRVGARDAQPFAITAAGRHAFADWVVTDPEPENLRIPLLLTMTFADAVPPKRLQEIVQVHYERHQRTLEEYEALHADLAAAPALQRATLEYGISYERAVLGWFDGLPKQIAPRRRPHR
jgi:DNA-binding PadR family transcriptional regulator